MSSEEMAKAYEPGTVEAKWYPRWEERGYFVADADTDKETYTIVIPPPNVTGILHIGHVLNNTLQDILIRFEKMRGKEVCWVPGTDHAGIATQAKVEQHLLETEGLTKFDLGREKFLERTWEWKEKYGGTIIRQLRTMGCACDWTRERFTMDEGLSDAVLEVFVRLYDKGLVYKGTRMINWCPKSKTALSDDEVEHQEVEGHIWHMTYPFADGSGSIVVATTRPETMLGDTAVCVNPTDERYTDVIGKMVKLPLTDREIPIVADDYAKKEFGSGAVKVTPAHDPNDYAIGQRHDLPLINVMNQDGTMNAAAGEDFVGMDRYECREAVLEQLRELGLLVKTEAHTHQVGYSQRGHVPVEPMISEQWFVDMKTLAKPALKAVNDGEIRFHPQRWVKTYNYWLENVQDWCISRQLWWGHRIPVWKSPPEYRDCTDDFECHRAVDPLNDEFIGLWETLHQQGHIAITESPPEEESLTLFVCIRDPNDERIVRALESQGFTQDPDVLDTWFSSALWPLSTMGWPDASAAKDNSGIADFESLLAAFNPTSVLCTAREIITLWVSRMTMFNRYFLGEEHAGKAPFRDVFIHAMIQDGEGRKMSKSLGNGVDPLDIIHSHGSDAMRFTLCQMTTQTQDVRMPVELDEATGKNTSPKFDLGRNLCNKLWNASKFALGMFEKAELSAGIPISPEELSLVDRWMLSRVTEAANKVNTALRSYMFKDYADAIYDLFWRDFCDWYLESIKPTIADSPEQAAVLRTVIDAILRLMHPVMPFITETLFERFESLPMREIEGFRFELTPSTQTLCQSGWPMPDDELRDEVAEEAYERVRSLVTAIREVRATAQVKPKRQITLHVTGPLADDIARWSPLVETLAGVDTITGDEPEGQSAAFTFEGSEYRLSNLADGLDAGAERERLEKELASIEKNIKGIQGRLSNPGYVDKAPEHLVQQTRDQLAQLEKDHAATKAALDRLG